jgi:peroxidase
MLGSAQGHFSRGAEGADFDYQDLNPRFISNSLGQQSRETPLDQTEKTMFTVMFGQFINHDLERNAHVNKFARDFEEVPIDPLDPICFVRPGGGGPPLTESRCDDNPNFLYRKSEGDIIDGQFEVRNEASSYLDLNTVYGRNETIASILREGKDGKMKTENYSGTAFGYVPYYFENLPPSRNTTSLPSDTLLMDQPDDRIPTAGDNRISDNAALFTYHLIFLREHNRIAANISAKNPTWGDELIFQEARRLNIAQYQQIVMYEYLPVILGAHFDSFVGEYEGYNQAIDPTTTIIFATVAYRFGHSAIISYAPRDECGDISTLTIPPFLPPGSDLPSIGQSGGPFDPITMITVAGGFESLIRGLLSTIENRIDLQYADGIRNIPTSTGVVDILSLDVIRGRENGIPNYAHVAKSLGNDRGMYSSLDCPLQLETQGTDDPIECFLKITAADPADPTDEEFDVADVLRNVYGKALNVDAIIGMLAEPHLAGLSIGENFATLSADQFKRSRDGDRFWFENDDQFEPVDLAAIRRTTMKDLLIRNFDITLLPDEIFATGDLLDEMTKNCL